MNKMSGLRTCAACGVLRGAALLAIFTGIGWAQQPVNCTSATSSVALVRSEGKTEQVGDYLFTCTNASSVAASATITATLPAGVTVTSKVLTAASGISEAAVVVTGSSSTQQVLGTISGNVVTFANVPIAGSPTGVSGFVLDITNIRVDASTLAQNTSITETVTMTGTRIQTFAPAPVSVATTAFGLGTQSNSGVLNFPVCNAITAAAPAFSLNFGESGAVPNAFKTQGGAGNTTLLSWFSNNTETGYFVTTSVAGVAIGNVANSGTRVRVVFTNIPAGLSVYVPLNMASNQVSDNPPTATMVLTSSESGPLSPVSAATPPTGYTDSGSLGLLTVTGGTAEAVYEVTNDSLTAQEVFALPVYVAAPAGTVTASSIPITSTMSFAPLGAASNIPNFVQLASSNALNNSIFTACLGFSTSTWPAGDQGVAYSKAVLATGGIPPYTYTFISGTVPAGLTYNTSTGAITGVPAAPGTSNFTIKVTDNASSSITQSFTLTINPATAVTPATPATGAVNENYSFTPAAAGGAGSYTWSVTSGQVPGGLSFNTSTGAITGTPAVANTFNFSLTATDIIGSAASQAFTITINGPLTITVPQPDGVQNGRYSSQLQSTGGTGNNVWTLTGGTIPPGETFSASGILDGTLTTAGSFTFSVRATDSGGGVANQTLTISVNPPISIATTSLPAGAVGVAYSQIVTTSGGLGTANSFSVSAGALPPSLSLNSVSGAITGTPTTAGSYTFTVSVFNSGSGVGANKQFTITISSALTITTSLLSAGNPNVAYSQPLVAAGGTGTGYTWSLSAGALPDGLALNSSLGVINGTPTVSGTFNVTLQVTDSGSNTSQLAYTVVINAAGTVIPVNGSAAIVNISGTQYGAASFSGFNQAQWQQPFSASGPLLEYTVQPGTYTFRVIDPADATAIFPFLTTAQTNNIFTAWTFNTPFTTAALVFDSSAVTNSIANQLFSVGEITGSVNTAQAAYDLAQSQGSYHLIFAGGRNANPQTTFSFTTPTTLVFAVPDNVLSDNGGGVSLLLAAAASPLAIPQTSYPAGKVGFGYGPFQLFATGGYGTYIWSATGLAPGLNVGPAGFLGGTPTTIGSFPSTVLTATDPVSGMSVSQTYNISVGAGVTPVSIITTSLPNGTVGAAYNQPLSVANGTAPYQWGLVSGSLPPGLVLNVQPGSISGTPTSTGTFVFTVGVVDNNLGSSGAAADHCRQPRRAEYHDYFPAERRSGSELQPVSRCFRWFRLLHLESFFRHPPFRTFAEFAERPDFRYTCRSWVQHLHY